MGYAALILPLTAALVATLAGVVNTLAGGGSFAVIAALVFLRVDAATVNGTLRIGILVQCLSAALTFQRRGALELRTALLLAPAVALGGLAGALVGSAISGQTLRPLFGVLLCAWALLMLFGRGGFTAKDEAPRALDLPWQLMSALAAFYGGLLQAGAGFPFMAILVLYGRRDPLRANGIKVVLMAAYTLLALPTYARAGLIDPSLGAALAVGSLLGGWIGAKLQFSHGLPLIRRVFAAMLLLSGILMLPRPW